MGRVATWAIRIIVVLIALGIIGGLVVLVVHAPVWIVQFDRRQLGTDTPADAEARAIDSARQAVLFAAGGFIAIVTILLTLFRDIATRRAAAVDRDANFTRRYTDAISQLADQEGGITIHVGGIFALDRIARESLLDRQPIVDVLLHFVRDRAPKAGTGDAPAADVLAALEVVGRITQLTGAAVSVAGANLAGLALWNVNLRGARFDDVLLSGSSLLGADLSAAKLRRAGLESTDLTGAKLDFADMEGALAHRANFAWASLISANLSGANLEEAVFLNDEEGARDPGYADLQNANLERANLVWANMKGVNFTGAKIISAQVRETDFRGAVFYAVDVSGTDFILASIDIETARRRVLRSVGTVWGDEDKPPPVETIKMPPWLRFVKRWM